MRIATPPERRQHNNYTKTKQTKTEPQTKQCFDTNKNFIEFNKLFACFFSSTLFLMLNQVMMIANELYLHPNEFCLDTNKLYLLQAPNTRFTCAQTLKKSRFFRVYIWVKTAKKFTFGSDMLHRFR